MSVNFFETDCKEDARKEKQFGICDDQNEQKHIQILQTVQNG